MVYPENIGDDVSDEESELDPEFEVSSVASSLEDRLTWRGRMQSFLRHIYWSVFVISLILLDSVIVLFENLLEIGALGNFDCLHGAELIEQAEFCHFRHEPTSDCAAPFSNFFCNISSNAPVGVARLNFTYDQCLMLGGVPPEICTCKFKPPN